MKCVFFGEQVSQALSLTYLLTTMAAIFELQCYYGEICNTRRYYKRWIYGWFEAKGDGYNITYVQRGKAPTSGDIRSNSKWGKIS